MADTAPEVTVEAMEGTAVKAALAATRASLAVSAKAELPEASTLGAKALAHRRHRLRALLETATGILVQVIRHHLPQTRISIQ